MQIMRKSSSGFSV